jgi:hypothetical protein
MIALVLFCACIAEIAAILIGHAIHWHYMTPEQREAYTAKNKADAVMRQESTDRAREEREQRKREQPIFVGYSGYENAPTRKDIQKPVVVKTLPRMTAPYVRNRLIEDMAANGYAASNLVRTTTGKTTWWRRLANKFCRC